MTDICKADTSTTCRQSKPLQEWLTQQAKQDLLRFITCGSVDDGKSTLIGRLLWESRQLFDGQLTNLQADSKRYGTQGERIDFALLVDGLSAEREQGITIDVAYRFFRTEWRRFIVADTPGHEEYIRNMVTGASTADVAILLVDAKRGLLTQTRRHAFLVSLIGIRHVVLAVNKMDQIGFDKSIFESIRDAFVTFTKPLGFTNIRAIPLSALLGDNIVERSIHMKWYLGPTLMSYLETVTVRPQIGNQFIFPIQWVNRSNADFRGFSGTVAGGNVQLGDELYVTNSGQTARVAKIITFNETKEQAQMGDAITLTLDREIDISRGDVLTKASHPLNMSDQFEVTLIWMHEDVGLIGRSYDLKLANQWTSATITNIKHRVNVNTLAFEPCRQLNFNDISSCNIATSKSLVFTSYEHSTSLGSFILVDRLTMATIAAGIIHHNLRRAQNVHRQALSISRMDREQLNGHQGKVIWFTGLSGSGKSTLANALEQALHAEHKRTYILDGDNIRQGLNKDLGFTDADRVENIRRIIEVAKLMMDAGLIVITAFISPFRHERKMAREQIGQTHFIEVFINTPLELCEQRDPKGLYKKARLGLLPNMTGINSPYEIPENAEIQLDGQSDIKTQISKILTYLNL